MPLGMGKVTGRHFARKWHEIPVYMCPSPARWSSARNLAYMSWIASAYENAPKCMRLLEPCAARLKKYFIVSVGGMATNNAEAWWVWMSCATNCDRRAPSA